MPTGKAALHAGLSGLRKGIVDAEAGEFLRECYCQSFKHLNKLRWSGLVRQLEY
jgi:hypothetical protein